MKLPNASLAQVDVRKLADYCLNPDHPRGRHKARVFDAALGFTRHHAEQLRHALLRIAGSQDATIAESDEFGSRYIIDAEIQGPKGIAAVRSIWIIKVADDKPTLVTCYVL